jgi:hypothetical protein
MVQFGTFKLKNVYEIEVWCCAPKNFLLTQLNYVIFPVFTNPFPVTIAESVPKSRFLIINFKNCDYFYQKIISLRIAQFLEISLFNYNDAKFP